MLIGSQRRSLLAGDHALVDRHGRVGNRGQVMGPGNHVLVIRALPTRRHRQDRLALERIGKWGEHRLDHIRLHRDDHDVRRLDNLPGGLARLHAALLTAGHQRLVAAGAGAHVARRNRATRDPAVRHGARHVSESDEADPRIVHVHAENQSCHALFARARTRMGPSIHICRYLTRTPQQGALTLGL